MVQYIWIFQETPPPFILIDFSSILMPFFMEQPWLSNVSMCMHPSICCPPKFNVQVKVTQQLILLNTSGDTSRSHLQNFCHVIIGDLDMY